MKKTLKYFFSFTGKISRKEYILPFIIFILCFTVFNYLIRKSDDPIFISMFSFLVLVSFSSFTTRRLEDINVSYLWMLSIFVTPLFFLLCIILCFVPSKKIKSELN